MPVPIGWCCVGQLVCRRILAGLGNLSLDGLVWSSTGWFEQLIGVGAASSSSESLEQMASQAMV